MRRAALILAVTVALLLAGCTDNTIRDMNHGMNDQTHQEQTEAINQHTSKVVKQENQPVYKYTILELQWDARCWARYPNGTDAQVGLEEDELVLEPARRLQSFDNRHTLVDGGFADIDVPRGYDCLVEEDYVKEVDVDIERLRYNLSVYAQNGTKIHHETAWCNPWLRATTEDGSRPEGYDSLLEDLYGNCFDVDYSNMDGDIE